jgi:hypothetical protein
MPDYRDVCAQFRERNYNASFAETLPTGNGRIGSKMARVEADRICT